MKRAELHELLITVADECLANCDSGNPLESWTRFIDRLDAKGRNRIGDALEQQGRSRYTGKVVMHNAQCDAEPETLLGPEDSER